MKKYVYALSPFMLFFSIILCSVNGHDGKFAENVVDLEKQDTLSPIPSRIKNAVAIDTIHYHRRILALANNDTTGKWPVIHPYPLPGAILPYNRIVAYYGNLYSRRMGILGELPKDEMLNKLQDEVAHWQAADSTTKAIPALHYIAVTAQKDPGKAKLYRQRMPFHQIDTIVTWAKSIDALVFLDVQVGHSTLQEEVTRLETYLKLPNVHLGIDPEYSLKHGEIPGTKIGSFDSVDINDAIGLLAIVVQKYHLPPKILVVHRFTQGMVTDYENINPVPEVQVVMEMDGFGDKPLKKYAYTSFIQREPVQFAGFKIFYKNDNRHNWQMYEPEELLQLTPIPIYILYQ